MLLNANPIQKAEGTGQAGYCFVPYCLPEALHVATGRLPRVCWAI